MEKFSLFISMVPASYRMMAFWMALFCCQWAVQSQQPHKRLCCCEFLLGSGLFLNESWLVHIFFQKFSLQSINEQQQKWTTYTLQIHHYHYYEVKVDGNTLFFPKNLHLPKEQELITWSLEIKVISCSSFNWPGSN